MIRKPISWRRGHRRQKNPHQNFESTEGGSERAGDRENEKKTIVYFENIDKAVDLECHQQRDARSAFGKSPAGWHNATVGIFVDPNVRFGGKKTGGVRLRALLPPAAAKPVAKPAPKPTTKPRLRPRQRMAGRRRSGCEPQHGRFRAGRVTTSTNRQRECCRFFQGEPRWRVSL